MAQYPDEPGGWWTEFPGSERAAWATPSPPSRGDPAPARDGARDASRRALKHMLVPSSGKRERARREAVAEWRRQIIAAVREPSLKSGVITVGSGFGGTGKTDVAVTLAAIYAATRSADRVILADSNDDMPHGYIRLGGATVEDLPQHRRPLSIRGFHQACVEGRINVYADLRDAVAWLQGVAVIRGDTADESVGVDFGEQEYLTVLGFLQCMSNIVINDGGTGLFAKLQVGTLLHGDKYVFVTEASRLGFWSIGQVFSRYRTYEGEQSRPLTEQEMKHLNGLMDEATVVVDKFAESDPEQVQWLAQIRESFKGTKVSVVATPWDQALANRVPLNLAAVAASTLDAKLAMAEVVLRSADRANRRRQGLPEWETEGSGNGQWDSAEPTRLLSEPLPPDAGPDSPYAEPDVRIVAARAGSDGLDGAPDGQDGWADTPDVRIVPARAGSDGLDGAPDGEDGAPDSQDGAPDWWPFTSDVTDPILPRTESDSTDSELGHPGKSSGLGADSSYRYGQAPRHRRLIAGRGHPARKPARGLTVIGVFCLKYGVSAWP
jgi:MinD-like ATPase involved in chromosome partitioning or flagellar assembly